MTTAWRALTAPARWRCNRCANVCIRAPFTQSGALVSVDVWVRRCWDYGRATVAVWFTGTGGSSEVRGSCRRPGAAEPAPEPVAAYASVILDIPTRALSEPFAYGIPQPLASEAQIGSTVLVHFGNRAAAGYIVDIAPELGDLQGNNAFDPARIKPVEAILSKPLFSAEAARIARWMSREYVATLSECLRLFLPPGGSPRVVKGDDGVRTVERPAVKPIQNRWVMLTPEGFDYTPPKTAVRQRQLIEALQCGPGHDARPQPAL